MWYKAHSTVSFFSTSESRKSHFPLELSPQRRLIWNSISFAKWGKISNFQLSFIQFSPIFDILYTPFYLQKGWDLCTPSVTRMRVWNWILRCGKIKAWESKRIFGRIKYLKRMRFSSKRISFLSEIKYFFPFLVRFSKPLDTIYMLLFLKRFLSRKRNSHLDFNQFKKNLGNSFKRKSKEFDHKIGLCSSCYCIF